MTNLEVDGDGAGDSQVETEAVHVQDEVHVQGEAEGNGDGGGRVQHQGGGRKRKQGAELDGNVRKAGDMETMTVMFVDQTAGDLLAKCLQRAEDRIAEMVGYRVCRLLPCTNPWSCKHCGQSACYTCEQGERGCKIVDRGTS
jgi:hypothetical protein